MLPDSGKDNHILPLPARRKVRVLVVTRNLLLGDLLESLLCNVFTLCVHRVRADSDSLLEAIDRHRPQVIVLEDGLIADSTIRFLGQALPYGRIRLILVNVETNQVHVYDKFPVSLLGTADFIALVENFPLAQPTHT